MALDEQQLAVVLQASVDKARELIEADGGFLPFGARAKPSGEIEFVQLVPEGEDTPDGLQRRIGDMLAEEARRGEVLGSALVVNALLSGEADSPAIAVLIETPGFSRSVVVPYRTGDEVALDRMMPSEAAPVVFAGLD